MAKNTTTKAFSPCYCGCGFVTGGSSLYKQGHDAKHVSVLLSYVLAGTHTLDAAKALLSSTALQVKLHNAYARYTNKQAARANKPAKKAPKSEPEPTEVKVGRWWYPIVGANENGVEYQAKDGSVKTAKVESEVR